MKNLSYTIFLLAFLIHFNEAQAQWTPVSALANNIQAFFVTDQLVFVVGSSGFSFKGQVAKSTNGGMTFTRIIDVADAEYEAVHFVNTQTGFIAGNHQSEAVILKTINGGNTWETISLTPDASVPNFQDFYFINEQVGFLVGGALDNIIFKTIDGGDTWDRIPFHGGYGLMDIRFFNDQHGYMGAFDDAIYLTFDQGNTWEKLEGLPEPELETVYFINENTGFIGFDSGNVYRTEDGGDSWILIDLQGDPDTQFPKFTFVNDITGFLTTSDSQSENLYHSTDAGQTWTNIFQVNELVLFEFIEFNPSHTTALLGGFGVLLINTNASNLIETTSINSIHEKLLTFDISPNPTKEELNVKVNFESPIPFQIKLLDAFGHTFESKNLPTSPATTTFYLEGIPSGVYFIQIVAEKGISVKSFTKV